MIDQAVIFVFGALAIWLSQDNRLEHRRLACLFGLAAQPAWFHTAYAHHQWGVFLSAFLYAASWFKGLWVYWLAPRWRRPKPQPLHLNAVGVARLRDQWANAVAGSEPAVDEYLYGLDGPDYTCRRFARREDTQ